MFCGNTLQVILHCGPGGSCLYLPHLFYNLPHVAADSSTNSILL
jgi:hypothetical protein